VVGNCGQVPADDSSTERPTAVLIRITPACFSPAFLCIGIDIDNCVSPQKQVPFKKATVTRSTNVARVVRLYICKMEIKLYIGGIPADMDELSLAQMVGLHGDIATMKIVRDRITRKGKGYAFVEMVNQEGAAAAVEALNNTAFGGEILDVKPADVKQPPERPVRYERVQRANEPQRELRPRRRRL
jgi:hypothetical protein